MTENIVKNDEVSEKDLLDSAKTAVMGFTLPSGLLGDDGEVHESVIVKEMTGYEEDILSSGKMKMHEKIQLILERCTEKIGIYNQNDPDWSRYIKSLPVADRAFLCIKIREVSLGNEYNFKVTCPHCGNTSRQMVDLDTFKIEGLKDKKERVWSNVFPKSKKPYKAKVMTGFEEDKVSKINFDSSPDIASLIMMSRLVEIDGQSPVTLTMVKELPLADRNFLRKDLVTREGEVENKIDTECPSCSQDFKTEVALSDSNFFFQSE